MEVDFSNSSKEEIEFFYKKISTNIKKYRLEKGLSQEKLALDIGVKSIAFYSNCESCKNRSELDTNVGVRPDAKTEFNRTVKRS